MVTRKNEKDYKWWVLAIVMIGSILFLVPFIYYGRVYNQKTNNGSFYI